MFWLLKILGFSSEFLNEMIEALLANFLTRLTLPFSLAVCLLNGSVLFDCVNHPFIHLTIHQYSKNIVLKKNQVSCSSPCITNFLYQMTKKYFSVSRNRKMWPTKIDITGMDKAEVLLTLVRNTGSPIQALALTTHLNLDRARKELEDNNFKIDYYAGLVSIKCDFRDNILDLSSYDHDNPRGSGIGAEAIERMRKR